jgi:hypothetical protein
VSGPSHWPPCTPCSIARFAGQDLFRSRTVPLRGTRRRAAWSPPLPAAGRLAKPCSHWATTVAYTVVRLNKPCSMVATYAVVRLAKSCPGMSSSDGLTIARAVCILTGSVASARQKVAWPFARLKKLPIMRLEFGSTDKRHEQQT